MRRGGLNRTRAAVWTTRCLGALVLLSFFVHGAWGQAAGTLAELEGTAEIGRAGTWASAAIGSTAGVGDELRTGTPGRLRLVLRDNSVITLADASHIQIVEQTIDQARGVARTRLRLMKGKARALVSEYYERPGSEFHIDTAIAQAGVRGTEFVITYDPVADSSNVVGVSGRVEVHSTQDLVGHAVFVTAHELTTVTRGQYPTPARRLSDELFRQYLEHVQFIGAGKPESLAASLPLLSGASVPEQDRMTSLAAPAAPGGTAPGTFFGTQTLGGITGQPVPSVEAEAAGGKAGIRF
jgi:hypothetical protein